MTDVHLTKSEIETLKLCRQKAVLVEDLKHQMQISTCGAQNLSGMPGKSGGESIQERYVLQCERAKSRLHRESAELDSLIRRANVIIVTMPAPMARFAQLYYVTALEVEEIATAMGYSEKSLRRYRKGIERG